MDVHTAIALGRSVLMMVATISVPILTTGLVVGLVIALFQAVTSLQEQTLSMVPKILATSGMIFFLLPWILEKLTDFALSIMTNLASLGAAP